MFLSPLHTKILKTVAVAGAVFGRGAVAFGQTPVPPTLAGDNPISGKFNDIPTLIGTVFNIVVFAAGAIFVILLLIGGIQYLTAAGNEESIGKARGLIINSIVGLIVVLASWAIGTWVLGQVGFDSDTDNPWVPGIK